MDSGVDEREDTSDGTAQRRTRVGVIRPFVWFGAGVGAVWVGALFAYMRVFPDDAFGGSAYRHRDDALITLSHARGLVDVGTISIGATGARVEGFSSPLMFVLSWLYYRLGGTSAHSYLDAQLMAATFVLGVAAYGAMRLAAPQRTRVAAAAVAVAVCVPLFAIYPLFAWHASGMDNALTNALVVAAVVALAAAVERRRGYVLAGVVVGLLSLTRTEFIAHAAPLLAVSVAVCWVRVRSWRAVVGLVAPAVVIWTVVTASRVAYFGSITPNSGSAQRIAVGDNLRTWLGVTWPVGVAVVVIAVVAVARRVSADRLVRQPWCWLSLALGLGFTYVLARDAARDEPLPWLDALERAADAMGLWWCVFAAAALFVAAALQGRARVVHALLAVVIVTGLGHLLVFGQARLAAERVVTFVMVPVLVMIGAAALSIEWSALVRGRRWEAVLLGVVSIACWIALVGWWAHRDVWNKEVDLCCDPSALAPRILTAAADVRRETGIAVPRVANPDIGQVSLAKAVDLTDLGLLGDPLLRVLSTRADGAHRDEAVVEYLNHYAVPDVVEVHGVWLCYYASWLTSPEFGARYRKVWDDGWSASYVASACPVAAEAGGGIWVRDDFDDGVGAVEARLSRAFARSPKTKRVGRALDQCAAATAREPWACQHVTRSVLRNLRAFGAAGTLEAVGERFRGRTRAYDRAVIEARDRGEWYQDAADALLARG